MVFLNRCSGFPIARTIRPEDLLASDIVEHFTCFSVLQQSVDGEVAPQNVLPWIGLEFHSARAPSV